MKIKNCIKLYLCVEIFVGTFIFTSLASRPKESSVRLVGGTADHEGFLEIFTEGKWKQVSNSKWDIRSSMVVCKQLGYGDVNADSKR